MKLTVLTVLALASQASAQSGGTFVVPTTTLTPGSWTCHGAPTAHSCLTENIPDGNLTYISCLTPTNRRSRRLSPCILLLNPLYETDATTGQLLIVTDGGNPHLTIIDGSGSLIYDNWLTSTEGWLGQVIPLTNVNGWNLTVIIGGTGRITFLHAITD